MSFDDRRKGFDENNSDEKEFYYKNKNNSVDDFLKDEDFEFEGYEVESIEREGLRSKRIKQRKKRRRAIFKITAILFILVLIAVGIVFWFIPWVKNRFFTEAAISEEERITIPESLLLGEDINLVIACAGKNLLEPDVSSVIFSSYYSSENKLISLCVPPRTLMDIPGFGAELIGKSVNIGGMDLLDLSLEKNLGMDLEIDHHILFDVYDIVNKLGGIDLELENEITVKNYDDGSTFKLEKGKNLIDGLGALNFLKYFSGVERDIPIENIINQKIIVDAIIKKINGESDEEMSANLNLIKDFMDTDLSMEDALKIFSTFADIESNDNYIYALDVSSTELEGEDIVYVPQDISKLAEIFSKEGIPMEQEATSFTDTVKITILNGAYDSPEAFGLAANTSEALKDLKFEDGRNKYDVVEIGNSDNIYESTQILVYSPDSNILAAADDIKQILGTGSISVREDNIISSDIIIILGKDYLALTTGSSEGEAEGQLLKIIVINGEGTNKLAATVTDILDDYLNSEGEKVIILEPRSADNFNYTQTEIAIFTSREGVNELAQKIQEKLGVGVIEYSDNNVDNVDISITLGSDYINQ